MGPLAQIVIVINEYQQAAVSVRILGDVMNQPSEGRGGSGGLRPTLTGDISFDNVTFKYLETTLQHWIARRFGSIRGVVGIVRKKRFRKSTLTKIIQGCIRSRMA